MKIEKVEIKGLFGKKDISWTLNPQVNVLVGVNGSGKSTILSIVYSALKNQSNNRHAYLFSQTEILLDNKGNISFSYISFEEFMMYLPPISDENNQIVELKDSNLRDKLQSLLNKFAINNLDLPSGIDINMPLRVTHGSKNSSQFYEKIYYDLIEANISNIHANQDPKLRTRPNINSIDIEIQDTIDELNKIANPELIDRLTGSLNVFFNQIGKHVSYENNELVYTDTQLQQKLNYSHLSSGERQLIYILLRVALSNGDKSKTAIILMDEPEISLHLDWQEHFIKQLTILNPDAQFIIVTHSPALIMNGWNDVYVDMEEITTWQ